MATDPSVLSPTQLNSAASLLQNQGLAANAVFVKNVTAYNNNSTFTPLIATIAYVTANPTSLSAANKAALYTLGSSSCPALGDSVPAAGLTNFPTILFGNLLITTANTYMGNGDLSKFAQAMATAVGYTGSTNQFVNSAVNSQNYLGNTFTSMNNTISGGITSVNKCTTPWSQDLAKLGSLMNLATLSDLGAPLTLVKQLNSLGGISSDITLAFANAGVSIDTIVSLNRTDATASVTDQKAMYNAMTKITGTALTQALQVLGVTTPNINTMADLLNPYKLFPNSFQTLTVTGTNGVSQNIYLNSSGSVNSTIKSTLPTVALSSLS